MTYSNLTTIILSSCKLYNAYIDQIDNYSNTIYSQSQGQHLDRVSRIPNIFSGKGLADGYFNKVADHCG